MPKTKKPTFDEFRFHLREFERNDLEIWNKIREQAKLAHMPPWVYFKATGYSPNNREWEHEKELKYRKDSEKLAKERQKYEEKWGKLFPRFKHHPSGYDEDLWVIKSNEDYDKYFAYLEQKKKKE